MTMQATKTDVRVSTPQGQQIGLRQVKAIKLPDGWHKLSEVELTYETQAGTPRVVPFSEIQAFSDKPEGNSNS